MINKTSGRCIVAAEVLLLLLTTLCGDKMNVYIRSGFITYVIWCWLSLVLLPT